MTKENFFDLVAALDMGGYSDDYVLEYVAEGHTYDSFFGEGAKALNRCSPKMKQGRCVIVYQKEYNELYAVLDFVEDTNKCAYIYVRVSLNYGDRYAIMFYLD